MRMLLQAGSSVTIDGKRFTGKNITIKNGTVTIDGVQQEGSLVGDINITVEGNVEKLENSCGMVKANNVGSISTVSGDIECGDVTGSVSTVSGDIACGNIGGNTQTVSGDIDKRLI